MMKPFWQRKFFQLGVPFVIFVAGGSFFLKQFTTIRYDFRKGRKLSKEDAESMGINIVDVNVKREEILQEIQDTDYDQWENIRGPRPWEDSKTVQEEIRQAKKSTDGR